MNGSVMNVVCYDRSLLCMVCFKRVCFERTPLATNTQMFL